MKTISLKSLILAFIIFITPNSSQAHCSQNTKILIAGGIALSGFVLYKLVKLGIFDKSETQVINDSLAAINAGIKLSEIDIFDQHYNILSLTDSEKRRKIDSINEGILYKLMPAASGYSQTNDYLRNLKSTIDNIQISKKELKHCLKKSNSNEYDIHNLLNSIENLLPKIEFLYSYINAHQGYFNLSKIIKQLDFEYEREIDLVSSKNISYKDFKWIVRNAGCKINPKYPFISYINQLTNKTSALNNSLSRLTYKYSNLLSYANNIKYKLNLIYDNAIADEEYSKETKERDNENRKKEELALKEREFKLKEQMEYEKLALKERETAALEQKARAKEAEANAREREVAAREHALYLKQFEHRR